MGFKVTKDIEFENGLTTDEVYVRIEDYKLEKHSGMLRTFVNIYTSAESATRAIPEYIEDLQMNDASGILPPSMSVDNQQHMLMPVQYHPVTQSVEVEVTSYSSSFVDKEIDYVDFDDDGNEIISTRTESIESVTTGSEIVTKTVFHPNSITGSVFEYAYSRVKDQFSGIFGSESITDIL